MRIDSLFIDYSTKVFINMILQSTKHRCSVWGCAIISLVLTGPRDQNTSCTPTSPEMATMALLRFPSTAVKRSPDRSRPLDQVRREIKRRNITIEIEKSHLSSATVLLFEFICLSAVCYEVFFSGKYCPERADRLSFHSAPAFSLSGRHREGSNSQTPGIPLCLVQVEAMD